MGEELEVLRKEHWYPATALKARGDECFIHYRDYSDAWNEWIGPERRRPASASDDEETVVIKQGLRIGDSVEVFWKEKWWPAKVLQIEEDLLKIRYDDYDSSWDEWVGPERYRKH